MEDSTNIEESHFYHVFSRFVQKDDVNSGRIYTRLNKFRRKVGGLFGNRTRTLEEVAGILKILGIESDNESAKELVGMMQDVPLPYSNQSYHVNRGKKIRGRDAFRLVEVDGRYSVETGPMYYEDSKDSPRISFGKAEFA